MDKVLSFIRLGGIGNGVNRQGLRSQVAGGNGTQITQITQIFKSRRNKGNHRKCLRHRLRTEYVGHTEITEITESASGTGCAQQAKRKISFISFI